jgi:hypothetical protein
LSSEVTWDVILINHEDDVSVPLLEDVTRGEAIEFVEEGLEFGNHLGRRFTKQSMHNWIATRDGKIIYSVRVERAS